ncbi:putative small ubiquitin family modifier [Cardiosporidium cionae]|uniref:Small ubiquitin family modifier n=1 Tax=Cardiosporidium cionae TaxID=476202 RepID=A0ABQ7JBF5_9APIC|nr:putative small ubiquitin family modifier [Cardiosporidium cionae]|eukprot:KAF8820990.1 putative small ubiquitin family modifier [Cardiosporidium cionae]
MQENSRNCSFLSSFPSTLKKYFSGKNFSMSTADMPEGGDNSSDDKIMLKVKSSDGSEVFFKIRKKTKLEKLINVYCSRVGQSAESIRFIHDGVRLRADRTAEESELLDNDTIDAMVEQTGGCIV